MKSSLLLFVLLGEVDAHGSGAWRDPKHAIEGVYNAGMRYISETTHSLTMVGSDDGESWFSLKGFCTHGPDGPNAVDGAMTRIHFDFSPKGGPASLVGIWAKYRNGTVTITWPDNNVWTQVGRSSDVQFGEYARSLAEPSARSAASSSPALLLVGVLLLVAAVMSFSAFAKKQELGLLGTSTEKPSPSDAHAEHLELGRGH